MSYGVIEYIKEVHDVKDGVDSWNNYDGYEIKTDETIIKVLISNSQSCCETWGYLSTNDDVGTFIGAIINKIEVVDTALKRVEILDNLYAGGAMFINFETSVGTLQLVVYNAHNGYYGHEAKLIIGEEISGAYL